MFSACIGQRIVYIDSYEPGSTRQGHLLWSQKTGKYGYTESVAFISHHCDIFICQVTNYFPTVSVCKPDSHSQNQISTYLDIYIFAYPNVQIVTANAAPQHVTANAAPQQCSRSNAIAESLPQCRNHENTSTPTVEIVRFTPTVEMKGSTPTVEITVDESLATEYN